MTQINNPTQTLTGRNSIIYVTNIAKLANSVSTVSCKLIDMAVDNTNQTTHVPCDICSEKQAALRTAYESVRDLLLGVLFHLLYF